MSFRTETLKSMVEMGSESYKEGVRVATVLDDKAQKTGAIAGLFLAAALGFLKPSDIQALVQGFGWPGVLFLIVEVTVLVVCLSVCLAVMWLRGVPLPVNLSTQILLTQDLFKLPDDQLTEDRERAFYYDQIEIWKSVLDKQRAVNQSKARRLFFAQLSVAISVFITALLLVMLVVRAYTVPRP
jgi:hypothetical protein